MKISKAFGVVVGITVLLLVGTTAAQEKGDTDKDKAKQAEQQKKRVQTQQPIPFPVEAMDVDDEESPAEEMHDPNRPKLFTKYGMSVVMGGGVGGFVDSEMRDYSDVGGAWDARVVFGTRTRIAVEAGYHGTAADIEALGLDNNAALISTGLDAAVRLNVLEHDWQPYVIMGAGWRRYDLTGADFNTSSVAGDDDVFELPVGAGLSYRYRGLLIDLRAVLRPTFDNDLIMTTGSEDEIPLHNWTTALTGGWEF